MTKEDAEYVLGMINQESLHGCFKNYSEFEEIHDRKFHRMRKKYLKSAEDLLEYLTTARSYEEKSDEYASQS